MAQYFCCDCENLDRKQTYTDWFSGKTKFKCKACGQYKELDDEACRFDFKEIKKNTGSYTPSGCYITTIVCNILGYSDDCELLKILRNFRDTTLKSNPKYLPILFEYDQVGPLISTEINQRPENFKFCLQLLEYFLLPCSIAIKNDKVDEAVTIYQNMVVYLNNSFRLPSITIDLDQDYDLETLGKGRARINPIPSEI